MIYHSPCNSADSQALFSLLDFSRATNNRPWEENHNEENRSSYSGQDREAVRMADPIDLSTSLHWLPNDRPSGHYLSEICNVQFVSKVEKLFSASLIWLDTWRYNSADISYRRCQHQQHKQMLHGPNLTSVDLRKRIFNNIKWVSSVKRIVEICTLSLVLKM